MFISCCIPELNTLLRAINMFHTPLLPCVFVTPPMIPAVKRVPLLLPVPPARRQPHPLRPRAWGLSIDWQESTFSQEGPWTLRGGKGERERERRGRESGEGGERNGGKKEQRKGGRGSKGWKWGKVISEKGKERKEHECWYEHGSRAFICMLAVCIREHISLLFTLFLVREAVSSNPVTEALQVHTGVHCSVQWVVARQRTLEDYFKIAKHQSIKWRGSVAKNRHVAKATILPMNTISSLCFSLVPDPKPIPCELSHVLY